MKASKLLVAALLVTLPLAGFAQDKPAAPESKVTVTPYGFALLNAFWNTDTFAAKDYPGQVNYAPVGGAFLASARQSRFGVRLAVTDDNWTKAALTGVIEFDFQGGFATTASTSWNPAQLRLRLASATATWKVGDAGSLAVLLGQDYGLVNPLFGESIAWVANPVFFQAGNLFRRSPQIRATYAHKMGDLGFNIAAAILSPADLTTVAPFAADFGAGNASRQPDYEARAAVSAKFGDIGGTVGVGYHFNRRVYNPAGDTNEVDSTLLGIDAELNVTKFVTVKGEWYDGQAIDDVYAGLGIGAVPTTGATAAAIGTFIPVDAQGWWGQAQLKLIPEITIVGGYGQAKSDQGALDQWTLTTAAPIVPAGAPTGITSVNQFRHENTMMEAGVIFNAGKFWRFGVEWARTKSTYGDLEQEADQIALSSMLRF
jgi:hypothetical protein